MCLAEQLRLQKNENSIPACLEERCWQWKDGHALFFHQSCSNLTISLCFFPTTHSFYYHFSFSLMQNQRGVTPFILKPHAFQLLSHHSYNKALLLSQIAGFLRRIPASVEWQSRIRNFDNRYIHRYTLSDLMKLSIDLQQFSLLLTTYQFQLLMLSGKEERNSDTSTDVTAHIYLLFFNALVAAQKFYAVAGVVSGDFPPFIFHLLNGHRIEWIFPKWIVMKLEGFSVICMDTENIAVMGTGVSVVSGILWVGQNCSAVEIR